MTSYSCFIHVVGPEWTYYIHWVHNATSVQHAIEKCKALCDKSISLQVIEIQAFPQVAGGSMVYGD